MNATAAAAPASDRRSNRKRAEIDFIAERLPLGEPASFDRDTRRADDCRPFAVDTLTPRIDEMVEV